MKINTIHDALHYYLDSTPHHDSDYLFQSRNKEKDGSPKPLKRETVAKMVKAWTEGMKGNYSTHSLRKTWGYIQRTKFGVSFEIICKRFGHSSSSITMRYLGKKIKRLTVYF